MLIASVSNNLKVYDHEKGIVQCTYSSSRELLKNVSWSGDGKYVLLVGDGMDIDIVSLIDEKARSVQRIPTEDATYAVFQSDTIRNIAIGCRSGKTFIWDVKTKSIVKEFPTSSSAVKILDFNSKNSYLAAALKNGETNIFSLTSNMLMTTVKVQDSKSISSLAFHKEFRSTLGIATEEGSILVRDVGANINKMFQKIAHAAPVSGIVFSPVNYDIMGSCSLDKSVLFHDTRLSTTVNTIKTDHFFTCMDWNCKNLITLGTNNGETLIYDLRKYAKPICIFKDHTLPVTSVAFQPSDGKYNRNSIMSVSLKESYSPKPNFAGKEVLVNKTLDSEGFLDLMNKTIPHSQDSATKIVQCNDSVDSFLLHVSGSTNASGINIDNSNNISSPKNFQKSRLVHQLSLGINAKGNSISSVSTSTPVLSKNLLSESSPSPIKSIESIKDVNGNSDGKEDHIRNPQHSPHTPSDVETVCNKCNFNVANSSNDIKDFIRFSLYDISLACRNNHCQMVHLNARNRIFLEDQIYAMNQKIENIQSSMNTLIEENKKLMIEIQMLRLSKK